MRRRSAAIIAVLAAFSLVLAGCNNSSPAETPGTTQQPGGY
ncbi:MAG: hypothetical protein ACRDRV_09195 [Pseudonocardiaceae bacterium]